MNVKETSSRPMSWTTYAAARTAQVDPVLRAHDADVCDKVFPTAPQRGDGFLAAQALAVGSGAHDRDVGRRLAAPAHRDLGIGGVGRHDVIGGPEGPPLQREQPSAWQLASVAESASRIARDRGRGDRRRTAIPSRRRSHRAMGQKMSGGLHA